LSSADVDDEGEGSPALHFVVVCQATELLAGERASEGASELTFVVCLQKASPVAEHTDGIPGSRLQRALTDDDRSLRGHDERSRAYHSRRSF